MTDKKNPVGRPKIVTKEILDKLQYAFMLGCTDTEACFYADISPASLYNYQKDNPEFLEKKEAWKESPVFTARQTVIASLSSDPEIAFKYLERKRKDEFSTKQEIEQTNLTAPLDLESIKKIDELMRNDVKHTEANQGD